MLNFITVAEDDLETIQGTRCRLFEAVSSPLTAKIILDDISFCHRKRVIVICNTVSNSQSLFKDLQAAQEESLDIMLLHSRFLKQDRIDKETYLKSRFSENWREQNDSKCSILISTQVIEAGINITCEVLHTQLSPMNSLLQRAGRCARFRGEQGQVKVYKNLQFITNPNEISEEIEPQEPDKNKISFLPYCKKLCELTWQVLEENSNSEQVDKNVDFRTEERWIDFVHGSADRLQLEKIKLGEPEFRDKWNDAFFRGQEYVAKDLIRNVDSRSIFIQDHSSSDNETIDVKKLSSFSLPISTLCKLFTESRELNDNDWLFKRISLPEKCESYEQMTSVDITSIKDLRNCVSVLVNSHYAYYDNQVGLLIGINITGNDFFSSANQKKRFVSEYKYQMDTYVGHLGCLWTCWRYPFITKSTKVQYGSVRDELLQTGGALIRTKIFFDASPEETEALFEILVFFAVICHDLGKLQVSWQNSMRGWQAIAHREFCGSNPKSHLIAHTDYNPENTAQRTALRQHEKNQPRPNHAVESAYVANDILKQSLIPLLQDYFEVDKEQIQFICSAVLMAIGRHHSAWAEGFSEKTTIQLHKDVQKTVMQSWQAIARFLPNVLDMGEGNLSKLTYNAKSFSFRAFEEDEIEYHQLYLLIVRALRLCDQRSVQL